MTFQTSASIIFLTSHGTFLNRVLLKGAYKQQGATFQNEASVYPNHF